MYLILLLKIVLQFTMSPDMSNELLKKKKFSLGF